MYLSRRHTYFTLLIFFILSASSVQAQLGYDLAIKKPEPYENRELRAEKSGRKKFTKTRHFFQNTYTHYNYFFNANNRINEIISRAKESHRDDYTELLPFYNYSLDATASSKSMLDSVIYKSKTGIVMHDLRNDWIDDLYLLWGASYFLQKQFDSAYQMFQFINYAFAEKEKDGYYRYIGSRMDGNSALSIATKENDGLIKRMISDPPSRNTAFIWQIRTLIESNALTEAGSLIVSLKKDPNFPGRLNEELEEVQAYWFYKQNFWDSAATHLVNALDNAATKQERARWEYLIAQLYDRSKKSELAEQYFNKAISHTTDPIMDVYARLNLIRLNKAGGDNYIDQNIAELLKMARREKYEEYRDVIYFMAAQMELERNNFAAAQEYLTKGAKYVGNNPESRNRTFLRLAELAYTQKNYPAAASYYDSVQITSLQPEESQRIASRREALKKAVLNFNRINRQDSLQRIAAMPEDERTDYLKKLVRQLRRQQGLRDDAAATTGTGSGASTGGDAFTSTSKGEWYFYNPTLKKQGVAAFKQTWGNRPNVDNWRRAGDVTTALRNNSPDNTRGNLALGTTNPEATAITYEGLFGNLPLTPEQIKVSNEVIESSLAQLGAVYLNELEDYPSAIETYETLRKRFPGYYNMSEVLFNLQYSYSKTGNTAKAAEVKQLLTQQYPTSRQAKIVSTGKDPNSNKPSAEVTRVYDEVYNQFISGNFNEALAAKKLADSTYGTTYWAPQLLYIEAVYHVKQREDSLAKNTLNVIVQQNPNTPLAEKAANMINVLNRRKQIEEELQNLNISRPAEDTMAYIPPTIELPTAVKRDTSAVTRNSVTVKAPTTISQRRDTLVTKPIPMPALPSSYMYDANAPQYVVVVLNKVDNIFGNEARNSFDRYNKERYYNLPLTTQVTPLDGENRLVLVGKFSNVIQANEYLQKAMPLAPREIVPWLKREKYSFTIISEKNLELLKVKTDLSSYRQFLEENSGLKF